MIIKVFEQNYELIARGILDAMYDKEDFIKNLIEKYPDQVFICLYLNACQQMSLNKIGNPFHGKSLNLMIGLKSCEEED